MNDLTVIEHNNQRVLTTKQLAEAYETDINNIKVNFSRNGDRFEEGKHYFLLRGNALKEFKDRVTDSNIVGRNANQLYLWTERGALRHAKILDTDKAWEVYEKLEETYFRTKQITQTFKELSPQLQVLINLELKQKKLEEEITSVKKQLAATTDTIKNVKDTIIQRDENWREWVKQQFNKMAKSDSNKHREYKSLSYRLLEERARCNLAIRLKNLRNRLYEEGATKTKINQVNRLDVIEEDARLKEIYTSIIKELVIKYVA